MPEMRLEARPSPLLLDPRETAVIVIDMQQGFFGLGGAWDRAGVDVTGVQAILRPLARTLAAARGVGLPILYLTADFAPSSGNARLWDTARGEHWMAWRARGAARRMVGCCRLVSKMGTSCLRPHPSPARRLS
jgi:hypothetical protein